ncbi:MAG TPA: type II toxin-antitoxin system death-on-curing family toxin [Dermatophilaceae bacterium]|nr:type II toxin-antitoxin system death-on-curing family toxin [Dermatophilaceae bacterium]
MLYLTLDELLYVARRTLGGQLVVRDYGLLESAVARPRTTVFGEDAYASLAEKAAALTHSVARNHALVDGNKPLALAGLISFLGMNGRRLTMTDDQAYDFIMAIATGELEEVADIASKIRDATQADPQAG